MLNLIRASLLAALAFVATAGLAFAQTRAPAPILARHGMVASQEARATRIGVEVLEKGGNAVDAAVAVGFATSAAAASC